MVGGSNPPSATTLTSLDELATAVHRGARGLSVPPDASLVVAVSGGPDSMALLHGAARLLETDAVAWRLTVAHLDHALRAESAADARFVADATAKLGLPCEVQRADVAAIGRERGRSIEEAGREARYAFFRELAGDDGWIATGHTADDAAETVLLNLLRGTGTTGLRGIPARRGRIVRPLLGERRDWLRSQLDAAGIAYLVDPTNADPAYLRNRVRGELLPLMEEVRPGAVGRIVQFAALASAEDELLDELATAELQRRRQPNGEIDWRDAPPRAMGRRVLRLAIGAPAPSAERIDAVLDAAEGPRGGVRMELGGRRTASVRERLIRIE